MKTFALGVALALLALTLTIPTSAAEISKAAPATTLEQQTTEFIPPFELMFRQRCSVLQGTSCPTVGATMACTDACSDLLSCTCISFNGSRFWNCSIEC
jgi:hypothetical protein